MIATTTIAILMMINQVRVNRHLPPLHEDKALKVTAIYKASQIEKNHKNFSHKGFQHLIDLSAYKKYKWAGEILGYGGYFNDELLMAWLKSPKHRAIILDPDFKDIGCARTKIASVCHFGAKW